MNNVHVLLHAMGHFGDRVSREEIENCMLLIDQNKDGHATLAEPGDLIRAWTSGSMNNP